MKTTMYTVGWRLALNGQVRCEVIHYFSFSFGDRRDERALQSLVDFNMLH